MLRTRIMTALIILPVTLAVVFLSPPLLFKGIIALLLMIGASEFGRIADLPAGGRTALMVLQAAIFAACLYAWEQITPFAIPVFVGCCAAWLVLFTRLPLYRADTRADTAFRAMGLASALLALTSCWIALCWLHDRANGPLIVFQLLLIIWAADVGAYFSGKQFGRHKLAPIVSPNKTWEGVYGGIALALLATWLWSGPVAKLGFEPLEIVVLAVVTTLASIGGDLYISLHKRTVKLDDAGRLFPGHGGVLDRYDSLLAGAPFFALVYGVLAL
jgi:phosphatidate cytidylyltransferase